MRLTLRTMLACLDADDRLDPADVEDLSQKIQHSKYATDLAARIRRLVQHPRMGTPRLDAKGTGLDANSVAEYLDNTLAHERIADFERSCIESDVRLAEVGACHQILVLVLEQPADIDPAVRERMYRLGSESKRQVAEDSSEARVLPGGAAVRIDRPAAAAAATTAPPTPKPPPEVPEYLRAGRRPSLWPLALAAVLAFVAVGIGLRLMGPLDKTHPMAKLMGVSDEVPVRVGPDPDDDPNLVTPPPVVTPPADDDAKSPAAENELELPPVVVTPPAEPPMPAENENPAAEEAVPLPTVVPMPEEEPAITIENTKKKSTTTVVETTPTETEPAEPPTPPPADVGRFVSEDQVLVRAMEDGTFERLPARASLFAGDRLVVLPAYRPQLLLSNNVQFTATGETRLTVGMAGVDNTASMTVDTGRILAVSVGKANARVVLTLGTLQGVATFTTVDSEMAIEVRNYLPPGANPMTPGNTVPVVRLYTTRGKIDWQEGSLDGGGMSTTIAAGQVRDYVGESAGVTTDMAVLPEWIDGKNIADIDRRAAREVEDKLTPDRPLELALQEMASGAERRAEVRALAVRSLICLNQFEPFLAAIADETQRAYWTVEFDVCRDAIARNPDLAVYAHDTFVKLRGQQDGENLFRMMWGFSEEDLRSGLAEELVKSLDVELLDYRVLAFENLRRITGSTQLYQPQFPAARRKTPVAQWRERLKAGEIAYKVPPAPIQDPKPTPGAAPRTEAPLE